MPQQKRLGVAALAAFPMGDPEEVIFDF